MSLSGTDRQKRWRQKQKALGKKPYTVMLSRRAQAVLSDEKQRTGESLAVIIENAVLYFGASFPGIRYKDAGNDEYCNKIVDRIVKMRDVDRRPFIEIADRLTAECIDSCREICAWDRRRVYMLYHKAKSRE
jgi:hypothetical protein